MKEYIDREATLNERPEGRNPGQVGKEEYNKGWNDCRSAFYKCITSMPTADVVEVVRCDYCERRYEEDGEYFCSCTDTPCADDDFCSHGARMDKEDEHEAG